MVEYALVTGILLGMFYGLLASGLNLVFGMQRIVNIAHGDFVMLGAFLSWEVYYGLGINPLIAAPLAIVPAIIVGYTWSRAILPRFKGVQDAETLSLVLFFGLSQVIEAFESLGFGTNPRSIPGSAVLKSPIHIAGQTYPAALWVVAGCSLCVLLVFLMWLYKSRLGLGMRAIMADRLEAATVGVNVDRLLSLSFGIGVSLAAVAGAFYGPVLGAVAPNQGVAITTIAFAIIVLGSLGNPVGALVGGLIFSVVTQFTYVYASSWANVVPYVLVVVVMLLRPTGLIGVRMRNA